MKRGIQLSPRCFLRGEEAETVNHLFLHCRITNILWSIFINSKDLLWVMPRKYGVALPTFLFTKKDGRSSPPVSGGLCGKRGTSDASRTKATASRR